MTAAEEEGKGPAIGIDLGTSNARVGVWQHGRVEIIPDVAGSRTTPSYVAFTDTHLLIGQIAKDLGDTQTLFGTKRLLGMNFSDPSIKSDINLWPFKVVAGPNDKPMISIHRPDGDEKQISAKQISTIIIGELRRIAEQFLKCTVKNAVITVPAYFNTLQRQAVRDAGAMAGLNVLRIINDPSAAAIAYAFNNKVTGNVLVFDLGGGCFNVSILTIDDSGSCSCSCSIEVKANSGDLHLGGEDFDNRMFSYLVEELKNMHGIRLHPTEIFGLKTTCERAKKFFSAVEAKAFEFQTFYEGKVYGTAITRSKYEELNRHFFKRCMSMVQKCLWDAKMDKRSINHVILVGGSTKIPLVEKLLCEFFNRKDLLKVIDPEEAVTYGASILAAILCQRHETARDLRLLELTTTSVGLRRSGSFMDVVVPRSTPIPTKKSVDGRTKQRAIDISVYEGEESRIKFCKFLGKSEFCGFKHDSRLSLNFEIDADGILSLSAEHQTSGMQHVLVLHKSRMHYQGGDRKNHTINVGAGMLTRKLSAATALTISYVAASLHNQGACPYVRLDKEKIGCGDGPVSPT